MRILKIQLSFSCHMTRPPIRIYDWSPSRLMKKGVVGTYAPTLKPMKILWENDCSIDYGSLVILGGVYP